MAEKDLPIYEITIEDNSTDAITAISLVNEGAIEVDFIHFNKQLKFAIKDEEERIVYGPALIANKLIYRKDNNGNEFNVKFTTESVKNIAYSFSLDGKNNNVTLEHEINGNNIKMVETYLAKQDGEGGFTEAKKGDWFTAYKIADDGIWESVKDGTFNGFSIEIYPTLTKVELEKFAKKNNNNKMTKEKKNMFKGLIDNFNSLKNLFSEKEVILKLATILEVNKWEINVDQENFEVGTALTISYEYEDETETYKLTDGEYELEDGSKIQVDSDGIIVLMDGADTTTDDTVDEDSPTEDLAKIEKTKLADEVTIDTVKEDLITLTETVADLILRIEKLEGTDDTVDEDLKTKEELAKVEEKNKISLEDTNKDLLSKIEELESQIPATNKIVNKVEDKVELSGSKNSEFQSWLKLTQDKK